MNLPDDIPDDHIIIKYGYTDDLLRRTAEHIKTYEKFTNMSIGLMEYVYIDPKFLSQAEVKIKEFFNDIEIPINYESFVELVAINPKHEKMIKQQFKYLHTEFSGSIRELVEKIEKLKTDHQIALMNKDSDIIAERHISELLKKDLTIAKHELTIAKHELANAQQKNELLEMKLLVGK